MTKGELLAALEPFDNDQFVCVLLHTKHYPTAGQVAIQGVKSFLPCRPGGKPLLGILAHADNAEIPAES